MPNTRFKKHDGAQNDGQIIFMVADPSRDMERHTTGCVISMWQTGARSSYYDRQNEHHMMCELAITWVVALGNPQHSRLFVQATPERLERTLEGLHSLPDSGCDLSMVQPMFNCTLDRPAGGKGMPLAYLKLARLICRDY